MNDINKDFEVVSEFTKKNTAHTSLIVEEITFKRLINKLNVCTSKGNQGWRIVSFVKNLEELLTTIKTSSHSPEKNILNEYVKLVQYWQNIAKVESQKIMNTPKCNYFYPPEMDYSIKRKIMDDVKIDEKVAEDEIEEKEIVTNVSLRLQSKKTSTLDIDEEEKLEIERQNKLIDDMMQYVNNIKVSAKTLQKVTKADIVSIQNATTVAGMNLANLQKENTQLSVFLKNAWNLWMWVIVVLVLIIFIYMVIFIRLFKKPVYHSEL